MKTKSIKLLCLFMTSWFVSAQEFKDTIIVVKNTKLNYEYDVSWTKAKKASEIFQFIKNQSGTSLKASTQLQSILQKVKFLNEMCSNAGFESGYADWTGLSLRHGIQTLPIENGLILNPGVLSLGFTGLASGQNHTSLQTTGSDALLLASTPSFTMSRTAPLTSGTQSIRLGNDQPGYGAEGIAKRFVVTATNAKYYFQYALVMDKSHSNLNGTANGSEVFFVAEAVDMTGATVDKIVDIANPSNPFINQTNSPGEGVKYYRDWRCAYLDLSSHIGKEVVIMFVNSDCSQGGHNGYTYIDDTCTTCKNTEGFIELDLKGHDCIDPKQTFKGTFSVPAKATSVQISLQIYQSGTLITTIPATTISGTNYTVDVAATDFPNQTPGTCYDIVAKLIFNLVDLNGNTQSVVHYSSNPVLGVQYGQVAGFNNDVCFCINNLGSYCCDAENLVVNGNFEAGNASFSSTYSYNPATFPGQYDVTNSGVTFGASVTDHSFCADPVAFATNQKYLTVNGKTQQTGTSVIWEQTISGLKKGMRYRFCANFKNMKQCTFDILPKVKLEAGSTSSAVLTINMPTTNSCAWQTADVTFTASGTSETVRIYLDETGNGDGNDVAIDDVYVGKLGDQNLSITVQNTGSTNAITASKNTITTSDDILNGTCKVFHWFVAEVSSYPSVVINWSTFAHGNSTGCNLPPSAGTPSLTPWNLTTTFPGYTFANDKLYIVGMFSPECDCFDSDLTYQLTFNTNSKVRQSTMLTEQQKLEIIDVILNGYKVKGDNFSDPNSTISDSKSIFELYPNPAQNDITIVVGRELISNVVITDSSGKIVLEQKFSKTKVSEKINLSSLSSGLYYVKVVTDTGTHVSKLIKN